MHNLYQTCTKPKAFVKSYFLLHPENKVADEKKRVQIGKFSSATMFFKAEPWNLFS